VLLGKPQEVDVTAGSVDGPDPTAVLGDCCRTTVMIKEDHEFKSDIGMLRLSGWMQLNICNSHCKLHSEGRTTSEKICSLL